MGNRTEPASASRVVTGSESRRTLTLVHVGTGTIGVGYVGERNNRPESRDNWVEIRSM